MLTLSLVPLIGLSQLNATHTKMIQLQFPLPAGQTEHHNAGSLDVIQ